MTVTTEGYGDTVMPVNDAAIVRNLLIESVNDDGESMIYDWFDGNDTSVMS